MNPSPEATAWGKEQADRSPRWTDAKWQRVEAIFGVVFAPAAPEQDTTDATETMPDAA